jgi:pimeloyl-ACP methyl ester carboxylesterase
MTTTKDGTSIHHKDCGFRRPVVFSHVWPLSGEAFEDQTFLLTGHRYRVIAMTAAATAIDPAVAQERRDTQPQ